MEKRTLPYRPLFIVGLPRSGTTLVQLALSSHSATVTARETHLFDFYLGPMIERYDAEAQRVKSEDGIRHLLPNDAFLSAVREFAITALNAVYEKKPTALVVIEKSPLHLFFLQAIRRCLPEAYILHVIRDPRGVIASLKAAGLEDWGYWASKQTPSQWAASWCAGIEKGRRYRATGSEYREIRYEDLFVSAGEAINGVFEWLNLSADRDLPSDIRDRFPIGEMAQTDAEKHHPQREGRINFFRRGDPNSWREELAEGEIKEIEQICRSAMCELGYQVSGTLPR